MMGSEWARQRGNLYFALFGKDLKWITRSHVHVDRIACPWLISRFVDSDS